MNYNLLDLIKTVGITNVTVQQLSQCFTGFKRVNNEVTSLTINIPAEYTPKFEVANIDFPHEAIITWIPDANFKSAVDQLNNGHRLIHETNWILFEDDQPFLGQKIIAYHPDHGIKDIQFDKELEWIPTHWMPADNFLPRIETK